MKCSHVCLYINIQQLIHFDLSTVAVDHSWAVSVVIVLARDCVCFGSTLKRLLFIEESRHMPLFIESKSREGYRMDDGINWIL